MPVEDGPTALDRDGPPPRDRQVDDSPEDGYGDLLFEDFKQQCSNLQGQYTRMHNRLQLITGLNTALLPTLGAVAVASSQGEVGQGWLVLFPLAGLLLAIVGFVSGASDRWLVLIYRGQLAATAKTLLEVKADDVDYNSWIHAGRSPTWVEESLGMRVEGKRFDSKGQPVSTWERLTSWRSEGVSVTHLPAVLAMAFAATWLVVLVVLVISF